MDNDRSLSTTTAQAYDGTDETAVSPECSNHSEVNSAEEYIPVAIIDDESADISEAEHYQSNSSRIRAQLEKDGVAEQKKYKKKLSFFQWIADLFYHNKLEMIIALALVSILAIIGISSIEMPCDYTIAVYTYEEKLTSAQLESIADIFRQYGEDVDGDNVITVRIKNYRPYAGWYIPRFIASQKLYDDIYGERTNIFILADRQCCDNIIERFSDYHFESLYGDSKWVSLENTAFCENADLPVELGLMMFRPGSYAIDIADVQHRHKQAEQMLEAIAEDYPDIFDFE